MDLKTFALVFGTIFFAELGDKTQLATLLYSGNAQGSRWHIFMAAALALVVSTALAVLAGSLLGKYIPTRVLHIVAGIGFILVGVWSLIKA